MHDTAKEIPGGQLNLPQTPRASTGPSPIPAYGGSAPRQLPEYMTEAVLPERPSPEDAILFPNARAVLRPGDLLLGVQKDNSVYTANFETGRIELVCKIVGTPMGLWRATPRKDGTFYCSLSGSRWPGYPAEIAFGVGGAVFHVSHRTESMTVVPGTEDLLDPGELFELDDGTLFILDFQGFGGTGSINRVDPITGVREILYEGSPLQEPVAAVRIPDSNRFLIANSLMSYGTRQGPAGRLLKEVGAILQFDMETGELTTVLDDSSAPRGAIDSVITVDPNCDRIFFTRNDWPTQETAGIFFLEKDGDVYVERTLVESTNEEGLATFSRIQTFNEDYLFAVDSYQKKIRRFKISDPYCQDECSITPILGEELGMVSPLDTVESIRAI